MEMNRRQFNQLAAGAALAAAIPPALAETPPARNKFSVMLWTIEKQAPFDRCLEMVAEAGYQGVELIGEFQKWSSDETKRVMAKMRSLGLALRHAERSKSRLCRPQWRRGIS